MGKSGPSAPDKKDPEGTKSVSPKEQRDRQDAVTRDFIGEPPAKTDNPEDVPADDA